MICPNCNSETVSTKNKHHYTECGLDNVFLEGVNIYECSCGEKLVSIPAMPELHGLIGLHLLKKKSLLNGKEIRFLRKNMGLTSTKLSEIIGVDIATVSRWENSNQPIDKSHDRLIRLIYSNIKDISADEIKHLIEEDFKEIVPEQKDMPPQTIPWPQSKKDCMIST
jgi:putative zinc finger/helix-turn-helix YgiT family protein